MASFNVGTRVFFNVFRIFVGFFLRKSLILQTNLVLMFSLIELVACER